MLTNRVSKKKFNSTVEKLELKTSIQIGYGELSYLVFDLAPLTSLALHTG